MPSIIYAEFRKQTQYAECRYAECRYSECGYAECGYAECHYAECRDVLPDYSHPIYFRYQDLGESSLFTRLIVVVQNVKFKQNDQIIQKKLPNFSFFIKPLLKP
jgi:hypothetical protein